METGSTRCGRGAGPTAPFSQSSPRQRTGFPLRGALEVGSSKAVGIEEGGFSFLLCVLWALRLADWGSLGTSRFFPRLPLTPSLWGVCTCARVIACVCVCVWVLPCCLHFSLICHFGQGWLGWPPVAGRVQLLEVSNRACFRLGTAAARRSHSLLKSSR